MNDATIVLMVLTGVSWLVGLGIIATLAKALRGTQQKLTEVVGILSPRRSPTFFCPPDKPTGRSGGIAEELREMDKPKEGERERITHGLGMAGIGGRDGGTV